MNTLMELSNIDKSFGTDPLLREICFKIQKGERLTILGPGGSGKSTLLKLIMGLIPPNQGTVKIFGESIYDLRPKDRQKLLKRVSMAFQLGGLFDFMTVRENILFAMENMTSMGEVEMEERVVDFLQAVKLPFAAGRLPSELSGGMRRRVGIVRAMATHPQLVLLDEPTAGLDPVTSSVVIHMIHSIADRIGTTCLCVTSSVEVAFTFSTRVAILRDSQLGNFLSWNEHFQQNDAWVDHFLQVRDFVPPHIQTQL